MRKKLISIVLIVAMACTVWMTPALAAAAPAATESGIYNVSILQRGVQVNPQTEDKGTISGKSVQINGQTVTEYEGAVRLEVSIPNTVAQKYYLIITKDDKNPPTEGNLKYIDQATSSGGSVSFNIYPSKLENGKTYYISSSDNTGSSTGLKDLASFMYYEAYLLGDVDGNGKIQARDASMTLRMAAGLKLSGGAEPSAKQKLAADVDLNSRVQARDASLILRRAAGLSVPGWNGNK